MKVIKCLLIILGVILLTSCESSQGLDPEKEPTKEENEPIVPNEIKEQRVVEGTQPVSRALVAKMIALAAYSQGEIDLYDREITYTDTEPSLWFDSYINVVTIHGWFEGEGDVFRPFDYLTYKEANILSDRFKIPATELSYQWEDTVEDQAINYSDWYQIYTLIVDQLDMDEEVGTDVFVVIGTPSNMNDLSAWQLITDKGNYGFEGLTMDQFMDTKIKVLKRGQEILGVLEIIDETPSITNVWLDEINGNQATIFLGGGYRTYQVNEQIEDKEAQMIVDIELAGSEITQLKPKTESITGRVLRISGSEVMIEGLGTYPIASDKKVYSLSGELQWKHINQVIVGYESTEFIIEEGQVCAALIRKPVPIETIRVVLRTTGFNELLHQQVRLSSGGSFKIIYGEEQLIYEKGQELIVDNEDPLLEAGYITIVPTDPQNKIKISSIERSYGAPEYRGKIEIAKTEGGLYLINEVPIEDYLYAVVPSEMPTSYGLEAAKVQAICARSFAYAQFYGNRYAAYGAHVDDSVSCQVYNNYRENDTSIQAVTVTRGLGLTYEGQVVSANFFSTSSGHTADSGDVWVNWGSKEFPTYTPAYLSGQPQFEEPLTLDLSDEVDFASFIKNHEYPAYDSNISWYRWQVTMTKEQIRKSIEDHLESRYLAGPKMIKTLGEDNQYRSRPITSIGEVVDIQVVDRAASGILREVVLVGTEATIKVGTEYNIRYLLAPKKYSEEEADITITRKDGSTVKNYGLLPSAFFTMEKVLDENNHMISVTFYGGGYGHGVGMSQNGVKGMVDRGYGYEAVLQHFYTDVEIKSIY